MKEQFNIFEFVNLLKKLAKSNYRFVKFPKDGKLISPLNEILLRHDIDFSLTAARNIAFEENKLKIQSTFFVYLNSPFYNIAFEKDKVLIEEILSFNHDIALHYDNRSKSKIENEIEILSKMYPAARCDIISLHKPKINDYENLERNQHQYVTTYDNQYFKEIEYISDSKCRFINERLDSLIESKKSFQLLLHPIWWYYDGDTMEEKFEKLIKLKDDEIRENIRNSISQPLNI
jgi:hypothetical protein